jgi:hypothetical protein
MMPGDDLEALAERPHEQRVRRVELARPLDLRLDLGDRVVALEQARVVGMRVEPVEGDRDGCLAHAWCPQSGQTLPLSLTM